jgi:hypothetical protein
LEQNVSFAFSFAHVCPQEKTRWMQKAAPSHAGADKHTPTCLSHLPQFTVCVTGHIHPHLVSGFKSNFRCFFPITFTYVHFHKKSLGPFEKSKCHAFCSVYRLINHWEWVKLCYSLLLGSFLFKFVQFCMAHGSWNHSGMHVLALSYNWLLLLTRYRKCT